MVDGVGGFLVLDQNGMPYLALHWEKRFEYALKKYNTQNSDILMPVLKSIYIPS